MSLKRNLRSFLLGASSITAMSSRQQSRSKTPGELEVEARKKLLNRRTRLNRMNR